jgi:hypothetical protein
MIKLLIPFWMMGMNFNIFNMKKVKILKKKAESGTKIDGGKYHPLSYDTFMLTGKSHKEGGQKVIHNGIEIEAEGGEPIMFNPDGSADIFGNMIVPGTKRKFKHVAAELAKKEAKSMELADEGLKLLTEVNPYNKWDNLKFNSGTIMLTGGSQKIKELSTTKKHLANMQNALLELASEKNVDADSLSKGILKRAKNGASVKAANGASDPGDKYKKMLEEAAKKYGVDYNVLKRLVTQESNFSPKAVSSRGAIGLMQFTPETAKQYGISKEKLKSTKDDDVKDVVDAAVKHFDSLLKSNSNDYKLALVAYNAGQGAVEHVRKQLKKKQITGDEWLSYMATQREKNPTKKIHAWQNETYEYVTNIAGTSDEDFYEGRKADQFREKYYNKLREDISKEQPGTFQPVDFQYNPSTGEKSPVSNPTYNERFQFNVNDRNLPTDAESLPLYQVLPELYAMGTNQEEPVWMQQFTPDLYQPYNISFQDRLNANTQTFNASSQYIANNPQAQAVLAGQKYTADSQVLADEFRVNQGIYADVVNRNTALLNEAELKNLQLADLQYTRQTQAKSNTKSTNQAILNSITMKLAEREKANRYLKVYENLYDYRFDENSGKAEYLGPDRTNEIVPITPQSGVPGTLPTPTEVQSMSQRFDKDNKIKATTINTPSKLQQRQSIQKLYKNTPLEKVFNLPPLYEPIGVKFN